MRKKTKLKIINSLEVSSPCHNDNFATNSTETKSGWHCGECNKEVHDLSRYNQKDILKLINETKGNFCALIRRKADGSIITKEPTSYSRALLATGVILASTVLLKNEAFAQVGGIKNTTQEVSDENYSQAELGEIAVLITPTPNIAPTEENGAARTKESCQEAQDKADISPAPTRGKIKIERVPKTKK